MNIKYLCCAAIFFIPSAANGHFIWIVPENGTVKVLFSDSLEPDKIYSKRTEKIAQTQFWLSDAGKDLIPIALQKGGEGFGILSVPGQGPRVIGGKCRWGVHILKELKESTPFLLYYYPKLILGDIDQNFEAAASERLPGEIVPRIKNDKLHLLVLFKGKPVPRQDLRVLFPDDTKGAYRTKRNGTLQLPMKGAGTYALWARCGVEPKGGTHNGEPYEEIRHYATLVFTIGSK